MQSEIKDILTDLGYNLQNCGNYYRAAAIYRGGENKSSLSINKENGKWVDFAQNITGSFEQLVQLTAKSQGIDTSQFNDKIENFKEQIQNSQIIHKEKLHFQKTYPKELLEKLLPHFDFYLKRGISEKTLKEFKCGLATSGKFFNRYTFAIFDELENIIGWAGRYYKETPPTTIPKWKFLGQKRFWQFPLYLNKKIIEQQKEIIFLESIGDMLQLWENEIKNTLVLFGIQLFPKMITTLIELNPQKIIISLNNDQNLAGNKAAEVIKNKLCKYFNEDKIFIKLPKKNDFGECTREEILEWKNNL